MHNSSLYVAIAALTAVFIWSFYAYLRDWLCEKEGLYQAMLFERDWYKGCFEDSQQKLEEATEQAQKLKEDLRANMARELGWITERKVLLNRLNKVCKELTIDDMKKTQEMSP